MLSCKEMAEKANDYIDRDVSLLTRIQFAVHLFMCVHCRNYISQMRTTISAVGLRRFEDDEQISSEQIQEIVKIIKNEQTNKK